MPLNVRKDMLCVLDPFNAKRLEADGAEIGKDLALTQVSPMTLV